jgi:hypothetical protein
MIQPIIKLILLSPENVSEEVYWGLAGIYLMLWAAAVFSVMSCKRNNLGKMAWLLLVTCLPILGIALHCFSCLLSADYLFLKQFGIGTSKIASTFKKPSLPLHKTSSQPSS